VWIQWKRLRWRVSKAKLPAPLTKEQLRHDAIVLVRRWCPKLYLDEWRVRVNFPKKQQHWERGITNCDIMVDTTYLEATIRVFPSWFTAPAEERELMLIHELCHIHTQELADVAIALQEGRLATRQQLNHAHERLTQRIAYIAKRGMNAL
jgi:hypothetical protein